MTAAERVLDALKQPICVISSQRQSFARILYVNKAFRNILGLNINILDDSISFMSYLHDDSDGDYFRREIPAMLSPSCPLTIPFVTLIDKLNRQQSFHVTISFMDEVSVTLELQTFENSTQVGSHEWNSDFLENSPMPCQSVDNNGRIIWANKCMLNTMGYTRQEYIGKLVYDLFVSRDIKEFDDIVENASEMGSVREKHMTLKKKNGESVHCILNVNFHYHEDGTFHSRAFLRDDTEKHARDRVMKAIKDNEVTRSILELNRSFIRFVSHETRSPLNVVHGSFHRFN